MSTAAGGRSYTYDDLADFPDDGLRRELIDGELIVSPSPVKRHQRVVLNVAVALRRWCDQHGGEVFVAPLDVKLSETTVLEPDVLLVHPDQHSADPRFVEIAPAVVVEVSSPSTRRIDLVRKRRVFEREGCREFWFVDLDADRIEVYRLGADGRYDAPRILERSAALASPLLEGFTAEVDGVLGPAEDAPPAGR